MKSMFLHSLQKILLYLQFIILSFVFTRDNSSLSTLRSDKFIVIFIYNLFINQIFRDFLFLYNSLIV